MDKVLNLALVGASGVVGQKIIQLLERKNFLVNNFYPLGKSSVGESVSLLGNDYVIGDPQSSSHESCTLPPLVVNTVANRYQRGYVIQISPPYYEVTPWVPITHQ